MTRRTCLAITCLQLLLLRHTDHQLTATVQGSGQPHKGELRFKLRGSQANSVGQPRHLRRSGTVAIIFAARVALSAWSAREGELRPRSTPFFLALRREPAALPTP